MEFKKEEMRKCVLDIYELPIGSDYYSLYKDYFDALPHWNKPLKGFPEDTKNKLIAYVNYFYSPNLTCIKTKYGDYVSRKMACAVLAGFEVGEDGKLDKKVEGFIRGKNPLINNMIISFCRSRGSDAYATIAYLRDLYYRSLEKEDGNQLDGLELGRLIDALKKINQLEKEFLADDPEPPLHISLIQRIEVERLDYAPEDIAEKIDQGMNPLTYNPYEDQTANG